MGVCNMLENEDNKIPFIETKEKQIIYVFPETVNAGTITKNSRRKLWQIIPCLCGSLIGIPFGLMVGWPSPNFPHLLSENSTIPITFDQSALICGLMLIGHTVSTPFSSGDHLGPKYGIFAGVTLLTISWLVMWQARDIYWLLVSRFLSGCGFGYGLGQLKNYIRQMCRSRADLGGVLVKVANFLPTCGIFGAYTIGFFFDFRQFSIVVVGVCGLVLMVAVFLPSTPRELVRCERIVDAVRMLKLFYGDEYQESEVSTIREELEKGSSRASLWDILKNSVLRKKFGLVIILVFFQQFVGIPSTIVYSYLMFINTNSFSPRLCSWIYILIFLIGNYLSIFYTTTLSKKTTLIVTNLIQTLLIIGIILVLFFDINDTFWNGSFPVLMYLFVFVYTLGIGNIPAALIQDLLPDNARDVVTHFFLMGFSMFALVITKIFQVVYQKFNLYTPFYLFLTINVISTLFIIFFLPKPKLKPVSLS